MSRTGLLLVSTTGLCAVIGMNTQIPAWLPKVLLIASIVMLIYRFHTRQARWFSHAAFVSFICLLESYLYAQFGTSRAANLLVTLPVSVLLLVSLLVPVIHARFQKNLPKATTAKATTQASSSPITMQALKQFFSRSKKQQSPEQPLQHPTALHFILGEQVNKE